MEMIELKVSIEAGRFDALKYFMSTRENTDPQKALEKTLETDAAALPAAVQEELAYGIGFGTEESLAGWLESMES